MNLIENLPTLPERFRWGIEAHGEVFKFGIQSNGMRRDGVIVGYLGTWFWQEHKFITVELDDDDMEIYREMRLQALAMHGTLLEELRAMKERREVERQEDAIRREKISKVKDFLERNWK